MLKKRLHKKADVEIQINWIFVLIVGGIILIFFIGLVMKQKTVSSTKLNINIRESLDTIFTSSQAASGTSNLINTPSLDVQFDCNNYFVGDFDTGISKSLGQTRVVFAPDRLEGKQLITWSVQWDMPYKIIDFLYIIPKQMRYVFVYDTPEEQDFANEIYNLMPAEMNKEIMPFNELSSIEYQNNYKTRIVSFVTTPQTITLMPSFDGKDISQISVVPGTSSDQDTRESGTLSFSRYERKTNINSPDYDFISKGTFTYLDYNPEFVTEKRYPTLFAAIVTDSAEMYDCMLKKAFKRYSFITDIHSERIIAVTEGTTDQSGAVNPYHPLASRGCVEGLYSKGNEALARLLSSTDSLDTGSCVNNLDNPSGVCSALYTDATELVAGNKQVQEESCPLIY